ncbi:hypothetical protein IEZ26_07310 [Nocardioides cavernae]|uniref:Hemerythrin-like domain-containing protein n=1 Tax=Nocardioides cavernae TaxID=1921566 RepID=A0ABR8NB50_9ACTN|nr:hypothetical protein [Nocardioides cavernae]MBD3924420.1 hypothetical protein [Nocardioides cavernae]MBM7510634.1 hypothetical protein [Nocardioides cavernae]
MDESPSASDRELLEELRRHRAELRESMSALEDALASPAVSDLSRWTQRVEAALAEVSGDFRAHVDLTEGPKGLYLELLQTSPRLAGAVDGLTRDHLLVGGQLDDLLTRVAGPDVVADVDGVRSSATALLGRLVRHRQRGADLVFEAYEFDIGGET